MIRVGLITAGKLAALALFCAIAATLVVYLMFRNKPPQPEATTPKLQGRVVAAFNNTRYAHEVEGRVRFVLTAGVDRTYEDGTHELEQVRLESRGSAGDRNDVISADRAKVSDPADLNRLDAEFISNVVLQTSDGLTVKTEYLHYGHTDGVVDTKELVTFERGDLSGRTIGARIETAEERVHLISDVDLTIKPRSGNDGHRASQSGSEGDGSVRKKAEETPEEKAARKARKRERKRAARAGRKANRTGGSVREASKKLAAKPTRIQAQSALLEKKEGRVTFTGRVVVTQGPDSMRAERMTGLIGHGTQISQIEARGQAELKQAKRFAISASDMDFFFGDNQELSRAIATGEVHATSLDTGPVREARASTVEAIFVEREEGSSIDTLKADGDAVLRMHPPAAPDPKQNPTTREVTAHHLLMRFFPDGRSLQTAEATGDAVMTITPVRAEPKADKKRMQAPKMNAVFFEEQNGLKGFEATGGVLVEIESTIKDEHPLRTTTSEKLNADFLPESQDIERVVQEGDVKFNEGDRNGVAQRAVYEGSSEVLSLRGKRPMAWDSKGRTQADEIDYDRRNDKTHARGDVRTTYYSRESTNNSTPFKNSKSPVYVTADRADASRTERIAVFTGNARGWQDDSFIKADRIELFEDEKRMIATGNVETNVYEVNKKGETDSKREVVPGFASADWMTYSDTQRRVHYSGSVKARHGTDRIEAESAEVFLMKETNEVDQLTAEGNVVLTQPGRRGTGDKLLYTSSDGKAVLEGRIARVEDDEKGVTMGSQLTFYSRDDKVFVDNRQGTGRVRSVHKLTKGKAK